MSFCRKEGNDIIIFATKENHDIPSSIKLSEPERPAGVILADGSINWNCPCLGGMATGPCGLEFREAFSCFHYSKADPKGSNCLESFSKMQGCMKQYPTLYASRTNDELDEEKYFDDDDEEDSGVADRREPDNSSNSSTNKDLIKNTDNSASS